MTEPVSVVMAAWNAEPYIESAVRSVLGQSYPIQELIVVNDGSTDGTLARLKAIEATDRRLRVFTQENQGFAAARNAALREARGEWIAVADADDVQLPNRIELQMAALARSPGVTVCGAGIELWDGGPGAGLVRRLAPTDDEIRAMMLFESPIFDPTVIYKACLLPPDRVFYDRTFRMAADYDLWSRLAPRVRFLNLPDVVTRYRTHPQQVTATALKSGLSLKERGRIWTRLMRDCLAVEPSEADLEIHALVAPWSKVFEVHHLAGLDGWFRRLRLGNRERRCIPDLPLQFQLSHRWFWAHRHTNPARVLDMLGYFRSPLAWNSTVGLGPKLGLVARSIGFR